MKQARILQNIVGGSYEADSKIAGTAFSLNMYAENVEETSGGSYYTTALRSREGERIVLEGLGGKCRGMFVASDGSIFAAFGNDVLRLRYDKYRESCSKERVFSYPYDYSEEIRFSETGGVNSHVVWVDGSEFVYAYPLEPEKATSQGVSLPLKFRTPRRVYKTAEQATSFSEEYISPTNICSLKGSIIINDPESDTWYYTEPYILGGTKYSRSVYKLDGNGNVVYKTESRYEVDTEEVSLWDEESRSGTAYLWLDRYSVPHWNTSEYSADKTTGIMACGDLLYVLGERSIQVYTQSTNTDALGNSYMAFTSSNRNVRELGCKLSATIADVGESIAFVGNGSRGDCSVWTATEGVPVRISTNAIERELSAVNLVGSVAFSFSEYGHLFYCVSVPKIRKSFVFDFSTKQWHNRSTRKEDGIDYEWWVRYAVRTEGRIFIAGSDNALAVIDASKYDDYKGNVIVKRRVSPIVSSDFSPFILNDVLLVMNNGETTDRTDATRARNPSVTLEVSKDGGNTFSTPVRGYAGTTGDYGYRTVWRNLGKVTMAVLRFTITDRCKVVVTGAKLSFTQLRHF